MHIITILILIISIKPTAGHIIYPCNASPAFVLKGDTLQIQYKRDNRAAIDSIVLSGPFQRYKLSTIDSIVQEIVWDSLTLANYNIKLFSIVPKNTPFDLYDILIYAGDDSDTSYKTVRVLSTFPRTYSFIHLTDAHISREWGNGYALELQYTSRLVKLINILGVEFVVNTGDLIMEYSNDNGFGRSGSVDIIWSNFFNGAGGYDGFRNMNVPQFLVPGNHDYRSNYAKPVGWNIYCGYRNYSFCYGDSRFLAFDGELGTDYPTKQLEASKEWLKENGSGVFRTLLIHNRTKRNTPFCDSNKINLALMGHTHVNAIYSNGKTPTRELVTASAGHFGQVGAANVGWFRYITVKDSQLVSYPALQYGNTVTQEDSLTLVFENDNTGKSTTNKASLNNQFHIAFPACKIRFVMSKGSYSVIGGIVEQLIENDTVSVYDVRVDAPSAATVEVSINQAGTSTHLLQNNFPIKPLVTISPNPFNAQTKIHLRGVSNSSANEKLRIDIIGIDGKLVKTFYSVTQNPSAGFSWDASAHKSGLYLIKVTLDGNTISNKAFLIR